MWYGKNGLFYYKSIQDWQSYDLQNLGLKIHNFSLELKQSKTPPAALCWIISTLVRRYVFFNARFCKSWDCPSLRSSRFRSSRSRSRSRSQQIQIQIQIQIQQIQQVEIQQIQKVMIQQRSSRSRSRSQQKINMYKTWIINWDITWEKSARVLCCFSACFKLALLATKGKFLLGPLIFANCWAFFRHLEA